MVFIESQLIYNIALVSGIQHSDSDIYVHVCVLYKWGFAAGSDSKESTCKAGDLGSILRLGRSLEQEMAALSSILAWGIPWTEVPGGLQSVGLQRVGHDSLHTYTSHMHIPFQILLVEY